MRISVFFIFYLFISSILWVGVPLSSEIYVVPKPKIVSVTDNYFKFKDPVSINLALTDTFGVVTGLNQLKMEIIREFNVDLITGLKQDQVIHMGIPAQNRALKEICEKQNIWPQIRIGKEGYTLFINPRQIIIAAYTKKGLFYGIQTLKQIIRGRKTGNQIPCLTITDWPDLRYRGMQDDISRGPVPTKEYMRSQIRRCAELKYNMVSYYTEHIVKTKLHGDFAPAGGGISIEEWKDLSDYAAKYYIEIVGNFQSLGHFEKILSHPQYAPLGETKQMLSPIRPESFNLLSDIYAEMAPVFSSGFFNVNCDETWDLGRGESKKQVDSLGIGRVYANHINRIHGELVKYNKRILVWGDIILSNPEIMDMIPEDIVLGAWTYGADDPFLSYFMPFIENEFEFMFSCGVLNSNRLLPDYRMTMANIKNFVRTAASHGTLGMLCTVWDDGGNAFFPLDWYGVAYAADQSWNVNDDHMERFDKRFDRGIYGNKNDAISETFQSLIPLTDLSPTQEMNEQVLWKRIIPLRGEHVQLGGTDWYTVQKVIKQAEKNLTKANPVVYKADLNYLWLIIKEYDYMAQSRFELLRASQLYRNASFIQRESRKKAENDAGKALDILSTLREDLINIKETYAELWRLESRIYWLDHLMEAFDEKIYDYIHAEKLLAKSIADLSHGEYLSPPNEIRLDIEEHGGQYFQYWLLCGPFPNIMGEGKTKDYLTEIGGELKAKPIPGLSFSTDNGEKKRWMKYSSPIFSKIDLSSIYEENTQVVAYAYCRIESLEDQSIRATFGSNDGIQLILNGERIYKKFIKRSLILDEDGMMLPLKKGRNDLLVKIDQNKGGWGFSFRLPDVNVRNHKHKYRIVD